MAIDSKLARPGVAPIAAAALLTLAQPSIAQPLASWNDSPAKAAIVQFGRTSTREEHRGRARG